MTQQLKVVAAVDKATNRIVYFQEVGPNFSGFPIFNALQEKFSGTFSVPDAQANVAPFNNSTCYQFTVDLATGQVMPVATDVDQVMQNLILWNRKYETYSILIQKVSHQRKSLTNTHIFGQESVYARKESQARNFRLNGYKNPQNFPLVTDVAEVKGIAPRAAADEILQKARATIAVLRNTERNRMVYKKAIFRAQSSDELAQVVDNINSF